MEELRKLLAREALERRPKPFQRPAEEDVVAHDGVVLLQLGDFVFPDSTKKQFQFCFVRGKGIILLSLISLIMYKSSCKGAGCVNLSRLAIFAASKNPSVPDSSKSARSESGTKRWSPCRKCSVCCRIRLLSRSWASKSRYSSLFSSVTAFWEPLAFRFTLRTRLPSDPNSSSLKVSSRPSTVLSSMNLILEL